MSLSVAAIDDQSAYSVLMIAASLINDEKYDTAEILCDRVLNLDNIIDDYAYSKAAAYTCKGQIYAHRLQHSKAIEFYEEALKYPSNDPPLIRYYLSLSLFSTGKQKEGWYNLYVSRNECETYGPLKVARKRFDSKSTFKMQPYRSIVHVHADAGYGDNILAMRYLPLLAGRVYRVRYETKSSLVKLAQDSFPEIDAIPLAANYPGIDGLPIFNYHVPIIDLPYLFGTDIDTIPSDVYIKTDPELVKKYSYFKGKIGICWFTGKGEGYQTKKSIPFNDLQPIFGTKASDFVPLVPNSSYMQVMLNPLTEKSTWAETAALIENLDLVISIDTAIAHLAGAMGKPVWIMMHKDITSFQFMAECEGASWNEKSPWYPSMRIFRQKNKGDWGSVIESVAHELHGKAE